jgi:hypothetical protein
VGRRYPHSRRRGALQSPFGSELRRPEGCGVIGRAEERLGNTSLPLISPEIVFSSVMAVTLSMLRAGTSGVWPCACNHRQIRLDQLR